MNRKEAKLQHNGTTRDSVGWFPHQRCNDKHEHVPKSNDGCDNHLKQTQIYTLGRPRGTWWMYMQSKQHAYQPIQLESHSYQAKHFVVRECKRTARKPEESESMPPHPKSREMRVQRHRQRRGEVRSCVTHVQGKILGCQNLGPHRQRKGSPCRGNSVAQYRCCPAWTTSLQPRRGRVLPVPQCAHKSERAQLSDDRAAFSCCCCSQNPH